MFLYPGPRSSYFSCDIDRERAKREAHALVHARVVFFGHKLVSVMPARINKGPFTDAKSCPEILIDGLSLSQNRKSLYPSNDQKEEYRNR